MGERFYTQRRAAGQGLRLQKGRALADTVTVEGLKELDAKLADLPLHMAKSAVTSALRGAAKPFVDAAKQKVVKRSHALAESIGVKAGKKLRRTPINHLYVGPLLNDKKAIAAYEDYYGKDVADIRHGHLIEFGTEHSAADPFLRPALDNTKDTMIERFKELLAKRIDFRVRKLQKL